MIAHRNALLTAVAVIVFALAGPVAERLSEFSGSIWSVITAWVVIVAAWVFIASKLWREWTNRRPDQNAWG